jgi:hypothetical protein
MLMHCCIALDTLLKLTLEGETVLSRDGEPMPELDVYKLVEKEKALGHKYFSPCDNVDNEGRCKGHFDTLKERRR